MSVHGPGKAERRQHVPGFSVFDGNSWNTVLIDSKITDGWHNLVGVVNGQNISLYLDSVSIGSKFIPSQYGLNEEDRYVSLPTYMAASENQIVVCKKCVFALVLQSESLVCGGTPQPQIIIFRNNSNILY